MAAGEPRAEEWVALRAFVEPWANELGKSQEKVGYCESTWVNWDLICTDNIIVKVCEQKNNKDVCKKRMSEYLRRIHLLFRCNVISRRERLDLIGMKLTVISRRKIMNCFIAIRNQGDMVFTPDYQSNIFTLQKSWKSKEDEITSLSCPSRNIFLYIS